MTIALRSSGCAIMARACLRTRSKKFSSLSIELKMIAIAKPAGRASDYRLLRGLCGCTAGVSKPPMPLTAGWLLRLDCQLKYHHDQKLSLCRNREAFRGSTIKEVSFN